MSPSSGRFSSRESCSSRRAASSTCSASERCWSPPPPTLSGLGAPSLALGFLFLPPRQLLQLLEQFVDLLVGLLLLRALRGLVLVGHLVELELEEVSQVLGHGTAAATAAPAALLAAHLHLRLVLFLGVLQNLQRLLFRLERALRIGLLQLRLGVLHLRDGLRQQIGNLLERRDPAG